MVWSILLYPEEEFLYMSRIYRVWSRLAGFSQGMGALISFTIAMFFLRRNSSACGMVSKGQEITLKILSYVTIGISAVVSLGTFIPIYISIVTGRFARDVLAEEMAKESSGFHEGTGLSPIDAFNKITGEHMMKMDERYWFIAIAQYAGLCVLALSYIVSALFNTSCAVLDKKKQQSKKKVKISMSVSWTIAGLLLLGILFFGIVLYKNADHYCAVRTKLQAMRRAATGK